MTEEQLEAAARKLCEIRGWSLDGLDHLSIAGASPLDTPLEHCKREILSFYQRAQAIDFALGGDMQYPSKS